MNLSEKPYVRDVIYRNVGGNAIDGILSCGWLPKPSASASQIDFTIPYYSCFVLLQGSGRYYDMLGNDCNLSAGCLVERLPDVTHSTQVDSDGKWLEFYISFGRSSYLSLESLGILNKNTPVKRLNITSEMLSGFTKLLYRMKSAPDNELLAVLLNAQQQAAGLQQQNEDLSSKQALIEKACLLLGEGFEREVSTIEIANELNIGYESFRKLFKSQTGLSPHEYRIERKMAAARVMLLGGLTVKATAKELGYSDGYIFSKQFKAGVGISPSDYAKGRAPENHIKN